MLGTGATSTLRLDSQAMARGDWLRSRSMKVPRSLVTGDQPLELPPAREPESDPTSSQQITFDRVDPPVLGANPFVGLTREQVVAALARVGQGVAMEPGVTVATR